MKATKIIQRQFKTNDTACISTLETVQASRGHQHMANLWMLEDDLQRTLVLFFNLKNHIVQRDLDRGGCKLCLPGWYEVGELPTGVGNGGGGQGGESCACGLYVWVC